MNPFRRTAVRPKARPRRDELPRIIRVRSGGSWDEVHVKLVPGQTPEDFDQAARALAVARGVTRCQVRELAPNVVSIDYQRRDLLTDVITCRDLTAVAGVDGASIDLRRVWSGRTEYGTDWHQSLQGVADDTIKPLEAFVTAAPDRLAPAPVLPLPTPALRPTGGVA